MLIGHEKIFERLKTEALAGKLHHAQLFLGPEHVGKTKVARKLAIEMQGAEDDVILKKQIVTGVNADTLLFQDEGGTDEGDTGEVLPIETVREIIVRAGQSHNYPYLIVLIENIGRMTIEAVNTLLKILEEPNPEVVFFLTANNEGDIIPTIRSRVQITHFSTVSDNLLRAACHDNVYEEQLVMFAMGRPGKLIRLMEDEAYFEAHREIYQEVNRFLENPRIHTAFALSRKYEKHELAQEFLDVLLRRTRSFTLSGKSFPVLQHLDFTRVMDRIEETKQDLKRNVNSKLLLENLLLPFAP